MKKSFKLRYILLGMLIMAAINIAIVPVLAANSTKQLTANYNDIKIVIDGDLITPKDANGKVVEPFIVDGTTYLPVRAMCEAIGKYVEWDGNNSTVYVYTMKSDNDQNSSKN